VRVLGSHVLLERHSTKDTTAPANQNIHHILCVTLKDSTACAVDPAGAQHRQLQPVLPFDKYKHEFVAKVLARRPYGNSKVHLDHFTTERHPHQEWYEATDVKLGFIMEYVVDELEEWQFKHGSVKDIIRAKASNYTHLKASLISTLVTAAREFIKHSNNDPTSTAKLLGLNSKNATLSEEDKQRMKRKRDRELASMHPSIRELVESQKAQGTEVFML
jgi:hypothetical protein